MEDLKTVRVTRTINYSPDIYIEYCEEENENPTREGFMEFIGDWIDEDFNNGNGTEELTFIDNE